MLSWILFAIPLLVAAGTDPDPKLLEHARTLLERAPFIDTHNDLPTMLVETMHGDLSKLDLNSSSHALRRSPRLRQGGVCAQYWSIYTDAGNAKTHTALHEALREFDVATRLIESRPEMELARSADDIERITKAGKLASLFGVEGGHMIEGSPEVLRIFYRLGARYLTLTLVLDLNRLGMFVDISHVSAEVMRDVLRVSRAPVIFSHLNAYAIDPHPRNVPDDVLKLLGANGGVVQVNFIRDFVSPEQAAYAEKKKAAKRALRATVDSDAALDKAVADWEKQNPFPATGISLVADHIDHIRQVAGIDHIGIGADYWEAGPDGMVDGLGMSAGIRIFSRSCCGGATRTRR